MSNKTFLFQINVTRDCNLRCTHCYISSDKKASSKFMSEDQFIDVFEKIRDFLKKDSEITKQYNVADIHVIGGEPTMLGLDFYKSTMPSIRKLTKEIESFGIEVKLSIVTNLVTPKAIEISSLFDMIATSYEFETRFITKKGRPLTKHEKLWESNVRKLQDDGYDVTVTMAVTQQAVDKSATEVLNYFYGKGFKKVHLGFFIPSGDGLINMDNVFPAFEDTTSFLKEALDWYIERRLIDEDLYVNPIESMIESIYTQEAIDDIVCPIIPGSLDIDWNGETVTCIEAGGEIDAISLGNVFQTSIIDVLNDKPYRHERMKAIRTQPHCVGCDELDSCQSACGVLHDFWDGEGECPGFKGFIKYVRQHVEKGLVPKTVWLRNISNEASK